jgi:Secretion system C-terminal sorting domain
MKKIFTAFLLLNALCFFGQAPIIEGTYYPVKNTSIKQVWDTTYNSMSIPSTGPNQVWDYRFSNNQFTHVVDTFRFKFLDPSATPYASYFPNATHATFIRTPFTNISDSLYSYWDVTTDGLYNLGGFSIKSTYDSILTNNPKEFYAPSVISYLSSSLDTSRYLAYAKNVLGYPFKFRGRKIKNPTYVGYGTLMLPNGTYNKVALVKSVNVANDSIFIDWSHNGNYSFLTATTSTNIEYSFLRNNTFGSAYLMFLSHNPANAGVSFGWYTLPVDFGSISGSVFTSTTETTPVTNGEMYLYRENSNFSKNDILARTMLKPNGTFQFDSIPYGEYRIAVRPNLTAYPNSKITYYGDTTNWIDASTIITTTTTSTGHKIHLQYHPAPAGTSTINGVLALNYGYSRSSSPMASKPVPGIGVIVKKHPGNTAARVTVTDSSGVFDLGALDNGSYELFVDIPGMHMTGTYSFVVSNNNIVNGLDFTVGKDSIHPISSVIGIREISRTNDSKVSMSAFPNPYSKAVNVEVSLANDADVVLEVYNLLGDKIQTLEQARKQAGNHYYTFSAKSLNAAPGVYIIKLNAGNTSRVLKVIEQ